MCLAVSILSLLQLYTSAIISTYLTKWSQIFISNLLSFVTVIVVRGITIRFFMLISIGTKKFFHLIYVKVGRLENVNTWKNKMFSWLMLWNIILYVVNEPKLKMKSQYLKIHKISDCGISTALFIFIIIR